jgi:phage baseplate assembly protein W
MPQIKGIKRISPLDLNKNVTIGVAFPLDQQNMFKGTETISEQIKSNLINLLLTQPGERVNQPLFGVGLKHLLFESNIDTDTLEETIDNQIKRYIPDVTLHNVRTGLSEDGHTLFISIHYSNDLDKEEDSIQLNFN